MLRSRIRRRLAAADGFTLVELLVVILIIGVLVAIGLATLLNQRSKAQDTRAKTSAATAAKAMLVYNTEHGSFAGATPAALARIEPALGQTRRLAVDVTGGTFTVTVDSESARGAAFAIEREVTGTFVRTCTQPGHGSCQTDADALGNRW